MLSTLEAFTPLTETWGLLNSGRPTQRLAVATSQKVKICNLQLAPAQHHAILDTLMILEKRDSYFCSHLCSSPILNPQLALLLFHCFRSWALFHTSHVLPMTMFRRTTKIPTAVLRMLLRMQLVAYFLPFPLGIKTTSSMSDV